METVKKEEFNVIGIKMKTTNENAQSAKGIGRLWEKLMNENTVNNIPNKIDSSILSIYTNYEGDHTKPYDAIPGCRVTTLNHIPKGMIGQTFNAQNYAKFTSKSDLMQGVVYDTWSEVWTKDLNRTFNADFEVYGEKAENRNDAEVDIYVSIN